MGQSISPYFLSLLAYTVSVLGYVSVNGYAEECVGIFLDALSEVDLNLLLSLFGKLCINDPFQLRMYRYRTRLVIRRI